MIKRQLRSINVKHLSLASTPEDVENTPNFKDLIYEELYEGIKEAISSKKSIVTLFELNHSGCILELDEKYWITSLTKAIKYFETKEKYERCTMFNNLITKVNEYNGRDRKNDKGRRQYIRRKNSSKKKAENEINPK